ncbi:MAG: hypothetical protein ABIN18_12420 [Pseudomonadota bacterium]
MDSVLLGILVALAVWLFMKHRQGNNGSLFGDLFSGSRSQVKHKSPPKQREMPRIGTPGTITNKQISVLKGNFFGPTKKWSFEEAALILDSVTYLRGVCKEVLGNEQPPLELQNKLLAFVLENQDLRDYVRRWGEDRRKAGINGKVTKLKHNNQFKRVAKMVTDLAEG